MVSFFFVIFTSIWRNHPIKLDLYFSDGLKPPTIEMDDSYLNLPSYYGVRSLKLTAIAPQNWCLGECCPFGALGLFSGVLAVGFRGGIIIMWCIIGLIQAFEYTAANWTSWCNLKTRFAHKLIGRLLSWWLHDIFTWRWISKLTDLDSGHYSPWN